MSPAEPVLLWHGVGEHQLPTEPTWLADAERERAASLRFTKRRNDYLLGRFASKATVAHALNLASAPSALQRIEVRNRASGAERGAPELFVDGAPCPLGISITDRAGWGVCMLGPDGLRLGCDLELVEERSDAFIADYLTPAEQVFVEGAAAGPARWLRANGIWSAKESVLKVLRTGLRRDTRSVEIQMPEGAPADGWHPLRASTSEGLVFTGWWCRFGEFLLTCASATPTAPPVALGDPPALTGALPSHNWLDAPLDPGSAGA
ncbi:MAG: 4'-phosphopantetheinyl transferase superfamily protein [Myxococcales bacterium]|nr:4'-phosphopantetheinyl transferase superfamily protein [Myxococcales bacterium]